jgi:hypothetical protein
MEAGDFDHFLITRVYAKIRADAALPGVGWLRPRLAQFEAATVPSVVNQSTANFRWLLLIDEDSPQWLSEHLNAVGGGRGEVVLVSGVADGEVVADIVSSRSRSRCIITSRCDSDDVLAKDFIESVQKHCVVTDTPYFLNFPLGMQWSQGRPLVYAHPSNAFISCVSPASSGPVTCFAAWHDRLSSVAPVLQRSPLRIMWLQVIHGSNVANIERGARLPTVVVRRRFTGDDWMAGHADDGRVSDYLQSWSRYARRLASIAADGLRRP